jgi:phage shock protein PspC (stress-responsive transcriptional regulator)
MNKSNENRQLGGVCSGIAKAQGSSAFGIRLAFVALSLFCGVGLLVYIVAWIIMGADDSEQPGKESIVKPNPDMWSNGLPKRKTK